MDEQYLTALAELFPEGQVFTAFLVANLTLWEPGSDPKYDANKVLAPPPLLAADWKRARRFGPLYMALDAVTRSIYRELLKASRGESLHGWAVGQVRPGGPTEAGFVVVPFEP